MATRQETSAARRQAHYTALIAAETTAAGRLWKASAWLLTEARRAGQLEEVITALLGLVERVRERLPLTDAPHEPASTTAVPRATWRAGGGHPQTNLDRTERAA